jgi:hypothetical protein
VYAVQMEVSPKWAGLMLSHCLRVSFTHNRFLTFILR